MELKYINPILCLAIFFACTLLTITRPIIKDSNSNGIVTSVNDNLRNFGKAAMLRVVDELESGNAVYGIASQAGLHGCQSFSCPAEYVALRAPTTAGHVTKHTNTTNVQCICVLKEDGPLLDLAFRTMDWNNTLKHIQKNRQRRAEAAVLLVNDETNFTYVPPPKTDITPALLVESLSVQPQDTATVGSIMPHFQDGTISYGIQLNGLIPAIMTLNASTSLPCANIGQAGQTQPDLILRPKDIDNGTAQPYLPECNIVAVNMYDQNVIHYWVMNANGAIYSLVGNNKVMDIDQLNSTASSSLVLRAKPAGIAKRDLAVAAEHEGNEIFKRALSQPDLHTASMTVEACAAMKCNINGGKAAVFNPFTKTCWCQDPIYVEIEHV